MSEHYESCPKYPTYEELAEKAGRIPIPEKWLTREDPLTPEILQAVCRRLSDETPIAHENEWVKLIEAIYGKLNYSQQPEAQEIWELALERGIEGLAQLIENMPAEKVREITAAKPEGSRYKDNPLYYWENCEVRLWHGALIRMFSFDAGTEPRLIEKLAQQLMEQASIPFTRREKELGCEITKLVREDLIWQTAQKIAFGRMFLEGRERTSDDKTLVAETDQIANEAFQRV